MLLQAILSSPKPAAGTAVAQRRLLVPVAIAEHRADAHEEHRHEEHGEHRGRQHAADHAGADGDAPAGARPGSDRQRQHAQDEGHRGHEDRPQALAGRRDRRLDQMHAALVVFQRELHDQDRVLGRKSHRGEQAHLKEDVVSRVRARAWR